jgi:small basic protein (TIGR04137 family)
MSLHRSLKTKPSGLNQHRNVLNRAERLEMLTEQGSFDPENDSALGLVKVGNRRAVTAGKKKAAKADDEATEETSDD